MCRWFVSVALLLGLTACTKPELASSPVRAGSEEELAAGRADLERRFTSEALAAYDVAIQELQLAGMDRGLRTTTERAAAMRAIVNGKTVRAVEILGWQARRSRLQAEIKDFSEMLARDLTIREKTAATGTPLAVTNRIENEQDILAKLRRLLAEAEAKLAGWSAPSQSTGA